MALMPRQGEMMSDQDDVKKNRKKRSPWSKIFNLIFRVGHIAVGSALFGGLFWREPFSGLLLWHNLTIATGFLLIVSGVIQSRHWIYQGRGVMALLHAALVWLVHAFPEGMATSLMVVLASGVIGSHLPGNIRHWSFVHRRRID
jgi:uncharacterized membrane protein